MGIRAVKRLLGIAVIGGSVLLFDHQSSIAALVAKYRLLSDDTSSGRISNSTNPPDPMVFERYATAKRLLYDEVFADHRVTLYCACRFDAARRLDVACGSFGEGERARRVEVEHVIPAAWIGQGRRCWREPICRSSAGDAYRGRACCQKKDPAFRRAHNDLHNLWPAVGTVNGQRRHYAFALIPGEARRLGRCDVEIDHQARRVEPRPEMRGDIARIGLYMELVHGVRLNALQRDLFAAWDEADPPDGFELERDARITRLQGQGNPFVAQRTEVGLGTVARIDHD